MPCRQSHLGGDDISSPKTKRAEAQRVGERSVQRARKKFFQKGAVSCQERESHTLKQAWQKVEEQRFPEGCFVRPSGDNVGYARNGSLWRIPI
jgi:hypothetical protein